MTRVALLLATLLLAVAARAEGMDMHDARFLHDQLQGAEYEMAIADLAQQKSQRADIKDYARMVLADHKQLTDEMHTMARLKQVDLPYGMTPRQKTDLARLRGLTGPAFDQAYRQEAVRINTEDAHKQAEQLGATQDPDLRQLVQQLQAADTKHQQAAEGLRPDS